MVEWTKSNKLGAIVISVAIASYIATLFAGYWTGSIWVKMTLPLFYVVILAMGMMGVMVGMRATYWVKVQPLLIEINELKESLNERENKDE